MAKYLSKPVEVEAVQWDGSREQGEAIVRPHGYVMQLVKDCSTGELVIECSAPAGLLTGRAGDWFLQTHEVAGVYPCLDAVFAKMFEPTGG